MSGMIGRVVALFAIVLATEASAEDKQEPKQVPQRSFDRFELDPATADGLWAEIGSAVSNKRESVGEGRRLNTAITTVFGRFAYGMDILEGGLLVPYRNFNENIEGRGPDIHVDSEDGIGDLQAYGKAVPLRTKYVDAGGGLELTLPTGDDDAGLGSGELGMIPFGTAAVRLGSLSIQGHAGYLFHSDETDTAREASVYGGGFFFRVNEQLALRSEILGGTVSVPGPDIDVLGWEPGVDIRLPWDSVDILIRPTGFLGMTDDSADWGFGGSVVAALNP